MKFETIEQRVNAFKTFIDDEKLCNKLLDMGYFSDPASTKYHLSYEGGLFEHSVNVAIALIELTASQGLKWQREQSPIIIGLLHDICKCNTYIKQEDGSYKYNPDADFRHGIKSVEIAKTLIDITEEEEACILNHMGAFTEKEKWSQYTMAIHKFPNVLWTHTADMIASHIEEEK